MDNQKLFPWLAEYNNSRNLVPLKDILLGKTEMPEQLRSILDFKEGKENKIAKGVAIFANGDRLLKELIKRGIVTEQQISAPFPVKNKGQLFSFLDEQINEDGVMVYDGKHEEMVRVYSMQNNIFPVAHMFPKDSINYFGRRPVSESDIGNKSRLAIWITSFIQDTQAYLIKRTVFGPDPGADIEYTQGNVDLGDRIRNVKLGSVQLIRKGRLERTLSLIHAPNSKEVPYLDDDSKIVGVMREYSQDKGNPVRVSENIISPSYFSLN